MTRICAEQPVRPCGDAGDRRRGFSLLEVVLALAILAGAVAIIGELVRMGSRNAATARDSTQAQLLCEGLLEQVVAGYLPLTSVSNATCEGTTDWTYSIAVEPTVDTGVMSVTVTVRQATDAESPPEFQLVQWLRDPDQIPATETDSSSDSGDTASTSDSGDSL